MNLPVPPRPSKGTGDPEQPAQPVQADRPGGDRKTEQTRPPVTRKQLDDIFGDVLPTVTQDERDDRDGAGEDRDSWYRDNRPPHHG